MKMEIQEVRDGMWHWISTNTIVSLQAWTGKEEWCFKPVRVEHADLEGWLKKNLRATDHVVIESTTNAWHVYDLLEPLVERVVVANPIKVKQIAHARVKTDIRDTLILARLLAANLVPDVWVPPAHVRETAPVAVAAQAAGGDAHADREPDAQCGPSPSLAA